MHRADPPARIVDGMHAARRGILAVALLGTALAAQKTHDIGSVGAKLELDKSWRRQTLDKDDDADQFNGSKGSLFRRREMYATVRELQGIYENKADYVRALDALATVGAGNEVQVTQDAAWTRAARVIETEMNGVKLVFRSELLVQPGLSYHVLAWSPRKDRRFLDSRADELLKGFSFPAPDATWRSAAKPIQHRARSGGLKLTFEAAPATLSREPNEYDEQVRLASPDGEHIVMVYATDNGSNANYLLRQELQALTEYEEDTRQVSRKPFRIDGAEATLMICQSKAHATHSLLVMRDGRGLLLRYFAPGHATDARPVRDALLKSLAVEVGASPLTLPDTTAKTAEPAWAAPLAKFVRRGRALTELETWSIDGAQQLADGSLLIRGAQTAWRIQGDKTEPVYQSQDYGQWHIVPHRDGMLLCKDGKLSPIRDGAAGAAVGDAMVAAGYGDHLFVVRTRKRQRLGFEQWPAQDDVLPKLIRRDANGSEKEVAGLRDLRIRQLAVSFDGGRVAVRSWRAGPLRPLDWPQELVEVSTADGTHRQLGSWRTCDHVSAAYGSWLVTGTPVGQPHGIYRVRSDGSMQPLVTGDDMIGIACSDAELTYTVSGGDGKLRVVRVSIGDCETYGRACQPFSVETLDRIGDELLASTPTAPRTLAQVLALADRADAIAEQQAGAKLPRTGRGIEGVLGCMNESFASPNGNARRLLAVLAVRALTAAGATWVEPGDGTDWDDWLVRTGLPSDDPFAATVSPSDVIVEWLDDSEGGYASLERSPEITRGVPVLVGVDRTTLLQKARAEIVPGLRTAAAEGKTRIVADAVFARPRNERLRESCYLLLAEHRRFDAVAEIAQRFCRSDDAAAIDSVALFSTQLRRETDLAASAQLFEDAMKAIEKFPQNAPLSFTLARAAERAFPGEPAKARQCYERALQLERYGQDAEMARAAIERLTK